MSAIKEILDLEAFNHRKETDKYQGIETASVIEGLSRRGWVIDTASQRRSRNKTKQRESYHVAKLSHPDYKIGDDNVNLVLINSNDGSSMFEVRLGIFRLACSNGLIVGNNIMEPMKIPHRGWLSSVSLELIDMYLATSYTKISVYVEKLLRVNMTEEDKLSYALDAFNYKHSDEKIQPYSLYELLDVERKEDNGDSAWVVYNRVQEHLIKGNYSIVVEDPEIEEGYRIRKARKISGAKSDIELNGYLSDLILEYTGGE